MHAPSQHSNNESTTNMTAGDNSNMDISAVSTATTTTTTTNNSNADAEALLYILDADEHLLVVLLLYILM